MAGQIIGWQQRKSWDSDFVSADMASVFGVLKQVELRQEIILNRHIMNSQTLSKEHLPRIIRWSENSRLPPGTASLNTYMILPQDATFPSSSQHSGTDLIKAPNWLFSLFLLLLHSLC